MLDLRFCTLCKQNIELHASNIIIFTTVMLYSFYVRVYLFKVRSVVKYFRCISSLLRTRMCNVDGMYKNVFKKMKLIIMTGVVRQYGVTIFLTNYRRNLVDRRKNPEYEKRYWSTLCTGNYFRQGSWCLGLCKTNGTYRAR